jgi:Cdc6-like AAA superfamily ATPase
MEAETYKTFYEAVRQLELISSTEQEAEICLQDAVDLQRPSSDIRFPLAQMVEHNPSREFLESRFWYHLADEGDTVDSVYRKIDLLLHPDAYASCGTEDDDDEMPPTSVPWSVVSLLPSKQSSIPSQILEAVIHKTDQLMFLQGSAGTGKTFTVKALIKALESCGKKYLICDTTGIAAVQYPGGITLYSLATLELMKRFRVVSDQISAALLLRLGTSLPLI